MEDMFFNNQDKKFGDDLKKRIDKGAKLQIAASIFSIYGYEVLKKELNKIESLDFIFKDPTFISRQKLKKEERIFDIKRAEIEKAIGGTKFEVQLQNELNTKAIATECAKWIEKKVTFKTNKSTGTMHPLFNLINKDNKNAYINTGEFSTVGFGYEKSEDIYHGITRLEGEAANNYISIFNQTWNETDSLLDVTNEVIDFVSTLYKENSPEYIYYITLYNIFNEFLEDLNEDELANDEIKFKNTVIYQKLYPFQRDAVTGIINKLETHNGCILADSVGLGKTFTALAVMKYYQLRNKDVLVLCPKKLGENWKTYNSNYKDNILADDKFNYKVLYHTDLLRESGESNGYDLSRINWENFDLIVIDESHNFRNDNARKGKVTRYQKLLNDVIKKGVQTKVLMLSATPVNNKFMDLNNQLKLAYEGDTEKINPKISKKKSIKKILSEAQRTFNEWSKLEAVDRTSDNLYKELNKNFEFFKLLDSVTIARSRKHIEKSYSTQEMGKFPERLKPITLEPDITNIEGFLSIHEVYELLTQLNLSLYNPFAYIYPGLVGKYEIEYDTITNRGTTLKQTDREKSLQMLMRANFMKRLESSVESFRITMTNVLNNINDKLYAIEKFKVNRQESIITDEIESYDNEETDDFMIGNKIKIDLNDMDVNAWGFKLEQDKEILENLLNQFKLIGEKEDFKLQELRSLIINKQEKPINYGNKKVIIFTSFADTASYLYNGLEDLGNIALVTGTGTNKCNLPIKKDFNNILLNFSPRSKSRNLLQPNAIEEIDILVATDCISEGQNLQDCDYLINYDIHWNPVRIIQRFGRIDRIGSKNEKIQLVNFWPNISLDEYINLKSRVEDRMKILDMSATGSDNVLDEGQQETEFRKIQLEQLKEEVIDLEDVSNTISITDLGLNDFRMDLLEYTKENGDIKNLPSGIHSVISASETIKPGVVFILKNIANEINLNNQNQIHPFYIIYIGESGKVIFDHLSPKQTLDFLRKNCKGKVEPISEAYEKFNKITKDGKDMSMYSNLLDEAISTVINKNESTAFESLFSTNGICLDTVTGLDDFELVTFLAII